MKLPPNYVIDFDRKKLITATKIKDVNRRIKGVVEIEIRNKDGSLSQKVRCENLINERAVYDMFYAQLNNMGIRDESCVAGSAFGRVFLTDYTGQENAGLKEIQGTIIGHASANEAYQGSNPFAGNINPYASYQRNDEFCLAFDFGSSQGNGTIASVWFGSDCLYNNDNNSVNGLAYQAKKTELVNGGWSGPSLGYYVIMADETGKVYALNENGVSIYNFVDDGEKKTLLYLLTVPLLRSDDSLQPTSGAYVKETQEFWVGYHNGYIAVYDKNFNLIAEPTRGGSQPEVGAVLIANSKGDNIIVGFRYHNDIYIGSKSQRTLNKSYGASLDTLFAGATGDSIENIYTDWNCEYLWVTNFIGIRKEYVLRLNPDGTIGNYLCFNETNLTDFRATLPTLGNHCWISESHGIYKAFIEPGSQDLLPVPRVKLEGQTMTILYKFTFQ